MHINIPMIFGDFQKQGVFQQNPNYGLTPLCFGVLNFTKYLIYLSELNHDILAECQPGDFGGKSDDRFLEHIV